VQLTNGAFGAAVVRRGGVPRSSRRMKLVQSLYETSEAGFSVVASLLRVGLVAGIGTASRVFFFTEKALRWPLKIILSRRRVIVSDADACRQSVFGQSSSCRSRVSYSIRRSCDTVQGIPFTPRQSLCNLLGMPMMNVS